MKVALASFLFVLSGCSAALKYYPVEGPLSQAGGPKLYVGKLTNKYGNDGKLSLKMDENVTCDGEWSSASTESYGMGFGNSYGSGGSAFGTGMIATSGGVTNGGGVMTCTDGNLIDVQLSLGDGTGTGSGMAKDKNGNVFRIIF